MANYARSLAYDQNNSPYPAPPNQTSYQSQAGVPLASSVITLSDKTTVIDVTAIGGGSGNSAIIGKWGSASVTATSYDWIVQSGSTRTFVVPQSVAGISSIAGANVANGLYPTLAVKTATAQSASIFTVEY